MRALSFRHRLALLIAAVAGAVILLSMGAGYFEMRRSDIADDSARLERVLLQLAGVLGGSAPAVRDNVAAVASEPAVRAYLRAPGARTASAALTVLERLAQPAASVVGVELWNAQGRRLLAAPATLAPLPPGSAHALIGLVGDTLASAIGGISNETRTLHYPVIARISSGRATTGYLVERRRLASSRQGTQQFRDILGTEAELFVGNTAGDLWTDFATVVAPPRAAALHTPKTVQYRNGANVDVLAATVPIPNSPWSLAVEVPLAGILQDVNDAMREIAFGSVLLLLLAVAGAWLLAASVTRPIGVLVSATEAIGGGDYGHRAEVDRDDELGTLATAFNRMAVSITDARAQLERKASELEASERRFRALIERSSDGITLISEDGSVAYQSPGAERVSGRPVGERIGQSYGDIIHPDDVARVREKMAWLRTVPGGTRAIEFRIRHADGSWRWIEASFTNLLDEPHVGAIVANYRDVTERKQSEEALRESEERFRQIAEYVREAFWVVDIASDRTLYMSPMWSEIWGRPIDDGYNLQIRLDTIHPDDRATADAVRIRLLDNEPMNTTYRIRRPDGTIRWIRTRVFPVTDKSGRPYRYVGVSEDVTDLRRAEERFAQAQKMDAVGRLAGGVAHDFNNLLTVILSYSDMLLEELSPDDPHRNEIQEIRKAGVSASTLTRQLLVFSRQQVVQPKVMRLNALVADAGKMLKRLIGEHVELATALDPQAGAVKVDAGQLEQVIVNLAVNARDAMPNGGRLMIESKNVEFIEAFSEGETSYPAGRYVTLAVSDNGTGMDAATQARVFEPFFTTKEPGKGTGLGLATVYGIVKQAGGYISLYSEPGSGTSFKIYFPRVDDSLDAPEELAAPLALPRGAETILVVEDEPAVRSLVRQVLERQGYHVLEVPDGESALDIASKHQGPIHLLLTDVVMPRMSGRIVADRFAAIRGDARILFVSGYTDDAIVHHGVLESGLQFLEKPFTPDALARKVREVLDLKPAAPLSSPRGGA